MGNSTNAPGAAPPPKRGRGRPPNSMNVLSKAARELAATTGKLPHEILLNIARGYPIQVMKPEPDGNLKPHFTPVTEEQVIDAAKAAAGYYAPKISTVEVITGVTDEDLDSIIERAAAEAEVSLGAGGKGTQGSQPGDLPASNSRERRPLKRRG